MSTIKELTIRMQYLVVGLAVFCTLGAFHPSGGEDTFALEVEIHGKNLEKGMLMVAVFDRASNFMTETATFRKKLAYRDLEGGRLQLILPKGEYAMAIYHDINENEQLDVNLFRYPTEPYGFSNNPGSTLGPPSFEKAAFMLNRDLKISIRLQ